MQTIYISEHQKKLPVAVTTESVADLPASLIKERNIKVIPHKISTRDGIFRDGLEITTPGLLSFMEEGGFVGVREPDASEYEAFFADVLLKANNIIHISITSKVNHSGCTTAMKAAGSFGNTFVTDSGHLSSGQGLMVIEACRMVEEGMSIYEIQAALEGLKEKISTSFVVDNMDYIVRDNHISPTVALITGALMIHPVIFMKKGEMKVKRICLGSRKRVWRTYIRSTLKRPAAIDKRKLFITHAGLSHKDLEEIRDMVSQRVEFEKVYFQEASPAIAANCGPGSFGLIFMKK